MDDVGPTNQPKGDVPQGTTQHEVRHQPWSCVDYVDTLGGREGSGKQKLGKRPEGRALSARFGGIEYADSLWEDGKGKCEGYKEDAYRAAGQIQPCDSIRTMDFLVGGGETKVHKWWTGKRTNHGWPGTAEGKMGTIGDYIILLAGHV